jgi:myosin heavy subunit
MYKCTAAIMHFGNSQWKQRPREEQAEAETTEDCEKVAHLLEIDAAELIKGLLKPRIKVQICFLFLLNYQTFVILYRSAMNMSIKVKIRIK